MAINYLSSIDLNQNELKRAAIENVAGLSNISGVTGQIIYDTTDGTEGLYVRDKSGNWKAVGKYDNLNLTAVAGQNNGALRLMEGSTVLDTITFQAIIGQGISIGAAGSTININHEDTSDVADSDNSNGVVLQDITFDTFGHVQTIGTTDLDNRYVSTITGGNGIAVTGGTSNSATVAVDYTSGSDNLIQGTAEASSTSGGGTYTDYILISENNPGVPNGQVKKIRLQNIPLNDFGAADGDIDMGGNRILDVGTPTASTDAATKSYVDNAIVGSLSYEGAYDASVAPPTGTGVKQGYVYAVTVAGNGAGFFTTQLRPGDMVIAQQDNPTSEAHWTEIQSNVDYATAGTSAAAIRGLASFDSADFTVNSTGHVSGRDATASTSGLARVTAADGLEVDTVNGGNFVMSLDESSGGNPLSKSVALNGTASNITRTENGGVTLFALAITSGFYGSNVVPKDLIVQVQETSSGDVVFTEIEKSSSTLNIRFNGSITNGDYTVLLMRAN
jgi:hypothetical protein